MDSRRLRSFVALAEELHFQRAAARSHITQSAMSQQLGQLEQRLGVQLVYRTKRRVALTQAGEAFLVEARKILRQMDEAARMARDVEKGDAGHLRVGVTAPALFIVFPEIMRRFREKLPSVRILFREMTAAQQEEALRSGEIEAGVLHPPLIDDGLACVEIASIAFDVVLSDRNPLAAQPTLSLADLANQPFILFPRRIGPRLYDQILSLCQQAGFSPQVIEEAYPAQSIVALAACGFGIGFVASDYQHFYRPMVVYRRLTDVAPQLTLGVAYRRDGASPIVSSFIDAARHAGARVR